jgi:hypothetical protein
LIKANTYAGLKLVSSWEEGLKEGAFAFLMLPPAVAVEEQLGNRDYPPCPLKGSVFSGIAGHSGRFEFFLLVFQNPDIAGIFGIAFFDGDTVVLAAEGVFGNKYIFALGALDDSILGIPKAYQMFLTKSTEACFNLIRVRGCRRRAAGQDKQDDGQKYR